MITAPPARLSLDEFLQHYGDGGYELLRGQLQECPMPGSKHGEISALIAFYLMTFVKPRKLGHVLTNDSFILLEREPLTVRGPDVLYISRARLPEVPWGVLEVLPELVVEVKSPSDVLSELQAKVQSYLAAGSLAGWLVDWERRTVEVWEQGQPMRLATGSDVLTLPTILPGFSLPVTDLFASTTQQ